MDIRPEDRARLDAAMQARVDELDITWREVAAAAGVSYETIRAARLGSGGIPRRTRRAIERGLRWKNGSVDKILDGATAGDPLEESPNGGPTLDEIQVAQTRIAFASPSQLVAMLDIVEASYIREFGPIVGREKARTWLVEALTVRDQSRPVSGSPGVSDHDFGAGL